MTAPENTRRLKSWPCAPARLYDSIALVIVIITEMIGSADGLGYLVMASLADLRTDRMLAGVVAIAVIGVVLDALLARARRQAVFWERHGALRDTTR